MRISRSTGLFVVGAISGLLRAHFLDRTRGRHRRRRLVLRAAASARRAQRRLVRSVRVSRSTVRGRWQRLVHDVRRPTRKPLDDVGLAHKVESVLFRDPRVPKGRINVNAENGVVFLRGQLDEPELIDALEAGVQQIAGVARVENLLHTAEEPAPASHGQSKAPPGVGE
jgi:osmotically-inducible protein OsmY